MEIRFNGRGEEDAAPPPIVVGKSTVQDVLAELGPPTRTHLRETVEPPAVGSASDYFFNYFSRGVDVLFDGNAHVVRSVVLRTNYPGHAAFDEYEKCHFVVEVLRPVAAPAGAASASSGAVVAMEAPAPPSDRDVPSAFVVRDGSSAPPASGEDEKRSARKGMPTAPPPPAAPPSGPPPPYSQSHSHSHSHSHSAASTGELDATTTGMDSSFPSPTPTPTTSPTKPTTRVSRVRITCDDAWLDASNALGLAGKPPRVYDVGQTANPFGPSLLYEIPHVVFESVGGFLASVTLF